jgi:hypothetical protein
LRLDREALSLAIALVLVGAPVWALHAWLIRRTTQDPRVRADELASAPRGVYFLVVLSVTLLGSLFAAGDAIAQIVRAVTLDYRIDELAAPTSTAMVMGAAWLGHVAVRRQDLRREPARLAGDWTTRLYLYGASFVLVLAALIMAAETLTILGQELTGSQPLFEGPRWFEEMMPGTAAMAAVATAWWVVHIAMGDRLIRAPAPMGEAHRHARSRVAYFLAVILLCAVAVLLSLGEALRHLLSGVLGVWQSIDQMRYEQQAYVPWISVLPFVAAWWFHGRRVSREALATGGEALQDRVVRARRLLVAFVGLAGLAFGTAWGVGGVVNLVGEAYRTGVLSSSILRADVTLGVAAALVGAVLWLPAWYREQRERGRDPVVAAASTARRSYLLAVSGVAVVAAMLSFAWLVYQGIRVATDTGMADDWTWAIGGISVALVVLGYHLLTLRSDERVAAAARPAESEPVAADQAVEELEILGPPDADFEAVNATIRSSLPKGFQLRIHSRHQAP